MNLERNHSDWVKDAYEGGGITSKQMRVFEHVWNHGGYIAGGFARVASRIESVRNASEHKEHSHDLSWRNLDHYTEMHTRPPWHRSTTPPSWQFRGTTGDVDFFFPHEETAKAALASVRARFGPDAYHSTSIAGFAQELVIDGCRYQFITKVNGTPEEVLGAFDLTNAKVALLPNAILAAPGLRELEDSRTLGIDRWDKPNLLWRVYKWVKKHRYTALREADNERYVDFVFDAMKSAQEGKLIRWDRPIEPIEIKKFVKLFMYRMPPRELLKASLMLDDYDKMVAMKHLLDMEKNDQR